MFLYRIHLNPRCREVRRDLSDPYQLHATLCRAFSTPNRKCTASDFLWRLEPENSSTGYPRILVQGRSGAKWPNIGVKDWLAEADPAIDLYSRLKLDSLMIGKRFRFRLRANPSVTKNGKRLGLLHQEEQEKWIERKGKQHGFSLPKLPSADLSNPHKERSDVCISQEQMLQGRQHSGNSLRIFSVLYDGILTVTDPETFRATLKNGIGHGKVLGLGLLSVVPIT